MRLIHVAGCALALVVTMTAQDAPPADSDNGDLLVGKVDKIPNTKPVSRPKQNVKPPDNPEQKDKRVTSKDKSQGDSGSQKGKVGTQGVPESQRGETKPLKNKALSNADAQQHKEETTEAKSPGESKSQNVKPAKSKGKASSNSEKSTTRSIDKNKKETKGDSKKVDRLNKELRNEDSPLSDTTETVLEISKKVEKTKMGIIIYAFANLIMYVGENLEDVLPSPLTKTITVVNAVANFAVKSALEEYYAIYQKELAEAVAEYVKKHSDEFKDAKPGQEIVIKTPKGEVKTTYPVPKPEPKPVKVGRVKVSKP